MSRHSGDLRSTWAGEGDSIFWPGRPAGWPPYDPYPLPGAEEPCIIDPYIGECF